MGSVTAVFLALSLWAPVGANELSIHDPWVAETPPGAMAAAVFMELRNAGADPVAVVRVSSPVAERSEFHRTVMDGDMARMERQSELLVPPGGSLVMAPGGFHIMLLQPRSLKIGDTVPLALELADGERVEITAQVRPRTGASSSHHHH
jgi:copper(I)-binding protein